MYGQSKDAPSPILPKWTPHPYTVVPIPVLIVEQFPRGLFTYLLDYDKTFPLYCGAFFLSGIEGHNILIDTGPSLENFEADGFSCKEILPMTKALKQATGCDPEAIDMILMTHLHPDHCINMKMFPNAKIIVQEAEWEALHHPPAAYRALYHAEHMEGTDPVFVHGDTFDVIPGIHLLFTPGHTPGNQSIIVDAQEGRVIVCGICCDEGNFHPSDELQQFWPDVLVPGIHVHSEEAYESLRKIKHEADYIVTMHDQKTYERGPCPNPSWPKYYSSLSARE